MPARPRQPAVPGGSAQCAVGVRTSPMSRPGPASVYVAFVIDAFARRIVGWRVSRTAHTGLRARCALSRRCMIAGPFIAAASSHHSDQGFNTCRSTPERLAEAGVEPSVSAIPTTMRSEKRSTALQGRGHSSARPGGALRGRRVRHARMGRLVQQSKTAGADRKYPAGGSRSALCAHWQDPPWRRDSKNLRQTRGGFNRRKPSPLRTVFTLRLRSRRGARLHRQNTSDSGSIS